MIMTNSDAYIDALKQECRKGKNIICFIAYSTITLISANILFILFKMATTHFHTLDFSYGDNHYANAFSADLKLFIEMGILLFVTLFVSLNLIKGKIWSKIVFYAYELLLFFYFFIKIFDFYTNRLMKSYSIFCIAACVVLIILAVLLKSQAANLFFENMQTVYSRLDRLQTTSATNKQAPPTEEITLDKEQLRAEIERNRYR